MYNSCGDACFDKCKGPDKGFGGCDKPCIAGCFCKDGYMRNTTDGKCVKEDKCCPTGTKYMPCGPCPDGKNCALRCQMGCVPVNSTAISCPICPWGG